MKDNHEPVYRIAVRNEGAWINAYVARMGTMDDAIKIATLLKSTADHDKQIFEAWLEFLQKQVDRLFERMLGERLTGGFTRHEPDTLKPYQPYAPSPASEPERYRSALETPWPTFTMPDPAPLPEFKSGGGGDFAGAGASGSWDAPSPPAQAAYEAPPPPPPEPPPPPPPEPPPPPPPSSDF